jgi:osmoprotectant transport system permease protein
LKNLSPWKLTLLILVCLVVALVPLQKKPASLRVGSKKFTESVILGEMLRLLAESKGIQVTHLSELGGTRLVFDALRAGEIDAYPDYTGTIQQEILSGTDPSIPIRDRLRTLGIEISEPLGYNNTYALGLTKKRAQELGLKTISDLRRFPNLRMGFSEEFLQRVDGWIGLQKKYQLPQKGVRGLDHDLAYRELSVGSIDVMDVYYTDAKVAEYDLYLLEDDLQFFPRYDAVWLYRSDLQKRFPEFVQSLKELEGRITQAEMLKLNSLVESKKNTESSAASQFLKSTLNITSHIQESGMMERIGDRTLEHLDLVRRSLIPAILVAIPLGIGAQRYPKFGQLILAITGLIQTIPALALLVMLIPVAAALGLSSLGSGSETAIIALFGYSLLPIVRNTYTGLNTIPPAMRESAAVLGLSGYTRLLYIELPLASPTILAGIKTAAVQNIGFAALGALIGAGGYGQSILTGIRLNSTSMILEGAIPAALLAILVQVSFDLAERWIVPRGLRFSKNT